MSDSKMKPKKGLNAKIIAGKYKGQVGKITSVSSKLNRVTIENINIAKKHVKPTQQSPSGGIVNKEKGIHISNIKVIENV
ncbi:50S ribosomal protein L24 [bacterium]|jgi:large subunit ribosomal protein L24|nr:50S ribosomal protein L24 [bacterium]NSW80778.1 50S ribosomal protein L24 [bacterium]RZP16164.1 MAG: 50S ribosomal protein L24 [Candidatus Dadabacteria bacterium]|tara:strand:+ start:104853 stop:105092 length:240 start_codon:yes stop_codon:yes gene_type:complete